MGIMEKNKILLFAVSDLFTEETLEHILRKVSCEKKVEILSWNFGDGSSKGDAYLSVVNRIKVKGIAGSSPTEISLVVKSMPRNLGRRKMLRSTDFFRNEITFHLEIYPKFQNFLKSKDMSDFIILPRWLAAVTDGLKDFLVMEDVSIIGFSPVTRQKTLNLSQCSLILKALARFQAVSFAYKDQRKKEFQKLADQLSESYITSKLYNWYKAYQVSTHLTYSSLYQFIQLCNNLSSCMQLKRDIYEILFSSYTKILDTINIYPPNSLYSI
ncbi:uncharacterized protein LOC124304754 [Neodiprion virginianus]|uniref:uncharacterized protein LOC124304754 n=1 Tax=Neodiprion virginianus TaxID=2961670 RepID=UPI001EE71D2A|nr:uncharacterized protein LOC124304754 [Neodiprion virginianus]